MLETRNESGSQTLNGRGFAANRNGGGLSERVRSDPPRSPGPNGDTPKEDGAEKVDPTVRVRVVGGDHASKVRSESDANGHVVFDISLSTDDAASLCGELVECFNRLTSKETENGMSRLHYADVEMNLIRRTATRAGRPLNLTTREFDLLAYFLQRPERVLTRDNLAERVWGLTFEERSNVVEVYISRIRKKLQVEDSENLIHTMIGFGYMLSREAPAGERNVRECHSLSA